MVDDTDDEAKDDIINAARKFLKEVLASKGRRTDVESNAFWAAAVALIPADVLRNRKGRAVMRLLDIDYHVVKKASDMRALLEDKSHKWKLITTNPHADRGDWDVIHRWLHSPDASAEDNDNKDLVRIPRGKDEHGVNQYEFHRARVLLDDKNGLRALFLQSQACVEMQAVYRLKQQSIRRNRAIAIARQSGEVP